MKTFLRFATLLVLGFSSAAALHAAGNLKVILSPISAVSAGAQWRVDSGAWQASGATVKGLSAGNHVVTFKAISGWIEPGNTTARITNGSTTTLTASYTQAAAVAITLTPAAAQWRIDGGAWLSSGTTAANLAPGSHAIEYGNLTGYQAPAAESVTLTAGQTLSLTRSYVQYAQLTVNLTPVNAWWRINGGTWLQSGSAVALLPGSYTIDYQPLAGYAAPAAESITLVAGQTVSLARLFIQLAQVTVTLDPSSAQWRIDGGNWQSSGATVANLAPGAHGIEYAPVSGYAGYSSEGISLTAGQSLVLTRTYKQLANLTVMLDAPGAQWRVDLGAWHASGSTVTGLFPDGHSIDYSTVEGYVAPASETWILSGGANVLTRSYTPLASFSITLTSNIGQWRLDGGSWRPSGALLTNLAIGTHAIDYAPVAGYVTPASETISLSSGANPALSRTYAPQPAQLTITTLPGSGQWQAYLEGNAPGSTWNPSGATVTGLTPGTYTLGYTAVSGYNAPTLRSITLAPGETKALTASYTLVPASIYVSLNQAGQWRVDGGGWQPAGVTLEVAGGSHLLEFAPLSGFAAPPSQTISVNAGDAIKYSFRYVPNAPGVLSITTKPASAQWRVDGGAWNDSGESVANLTAGAHDVEFSTLPGYTTTQTTVLWVDPAEPTRVFWEYDRQFGGIIMQLNPTNARWRVDGWGWWNSGSAVAFDAGVPHLFEYEPLSGFPTPHSEYLESLYQYTTVNRTYQPNVGATVSLGLDLPNGHWRISPGTTPGGTWQKYAATVTGLAPGTYTIEYAPVPNYGSPTTETLTLADGQDVVLKRNYTAFPGQVTVTLNPGDATWWIQPVNGPADYHEYHSGETATGLTPGDYTVSFNAVNNYTTPWPVTVKVGSADVVTLNRTYKHVYDVSFVLYPYTAQWRIDGGPWIASGDGVWNLAQGTHTIEYADAPGFVAPPAETIEFTGAKIELYRNYQELAKLKIDLYPYTALWRVDGGAWQPSGATLKNLAFGVPHTIDYSPADGFVPLPSETITLSSAQNEVLYRTYQQLAWVTVTLYPYTAQWRVDGGAWQASDTVVQNLAFNTTHTLEFSPVNGYVTPPAQTFTSSSGQGQHLSVSYEQLSSVSVTLYPEAGQWRVDGGAWQQTGAVVPNLASGSHTIEYAALSGYQPPPSETVNVYSGQALTLSRSYSPLP